MHADRTERDDAADDARTRADDAEERARAARDAAAHATTDDARGALERVADMHAALAVSHGDYAQRLRRRRAGDEGPS